jgi:hypothetical protein
MGCLRGAFAPLSFSSPSPFLERGIEGVRLVNDFYFGSIDNPPLWDYTEAPNLEKPRCLTRPAMWEGYMV